MANPAHESLTDFKPLYLKWLPSVYRYFYHRVGNAKDAEDLTSQVFLKVYEELPRYRDQDRFPAWLFTIARHEMADFFRSHKPALSVELADPDDQSSDLLAQAVQTAEIERLRQLIRLLSEEDQELIRLRFAAGLGHREIGELLNRKEDTVRKTLSRLITRLQNQLEASHE